MAFAETTTRRIRRNGPPLAATATGRTRGPELDLRFRGDDLLALRAGVSAYSRNLGAGELVQDIVLVAHELATNAVRHGGGSGRLRLWRDADRIVCQVQDDGPGLDPHRDAALPPASHPGGRGLWIARSLADVHIDTTRGTTITAAVRIPQGRDCAEPDSRELVAAIA